MQINKDECGHCFQCIDVCPIKAVAYELQIDQEKCVNCGKCKDICPMDAIS